MKLTKGMKKALSLLLSAAMVVTGVNVTTNTANAADGDAAASVTKFVYDFTAADAKDGEIKATINDSAEGIFAKDDGGSRAFIPLTVSDEIAKMEKPVYKVTALSENATLTLWDFNWKNKIALGDKEYSINGATVSDSEFKASTGEKDDDGNDIIGTEKFEVGKTELPLNLTATGAGPNWNDKEGLSFLGFMLPYGAHATIEIYDVAATSGSDAKKLPLSEEDGYKAFLMFADGSWAWQNMAVNEANGGTGVGNDAIITGDGTYTVSIDKTGFPDADPAEGATVFCVDMVGMGQAKNFDVSDVKVTDVVVKCDGRTIATDGTKMYTGRLEYGDNDNYRIEIRNAYSKDYQGFKTKDEFDALNEKFGFSESLSVTFTLKGIKEGSTPENALLKEGEDGKMSQDVAVAAGVHEAEPVPSVVPSQDPATSDKPATSNKPATTASAAPTAKAPTASAITTKPAVSATPQAIGTSKITPKQKLVVVAPGKSVKVAFTTKAAAPATKAAVVTASTSAKKVVTAKVSGKKVTIKAPKKAVKGSSATVTLKSTNGDKKVSAKIKVYVRNSAKKVKAAKKSITVKKNKTTKLVIKASKVQNKKKAFADTITVKGKILKLTNVKYAKGKATLTLKGAKKAKKKAVTIKVGKKSVKIKATVK